MSSEWSGKQEDEVDGKVAEEALAAPEAEVSQPQPESSPPTASAGQQSQSNASRYPNPNPGGRAPEGYYQPLYPPSGDGNAPPYQPPRGYEGAPPYGMPPPHMAGYPMYPYQPPMYGYPGYPPPPMYGYPPSDPSMQAGHQPPPGYGREGDQGASAGPYGSSTTAPATGDTARNRTSQEELKPPAKTADQPEEGEGSEVDAEEIVPGAVTARLKTYIKPRIPSTRDVLDRRSRKNAQSRARANKLRDRIVEIEKKPESERTDEEKQIFSQYESRRQRKNDRSRERALEKKEEIERILSKPEKKRTKIEKAFLDNALGAKKRKNEGDRLRRQRLKHLGLSSKGSGVKPGVSARGPMPHKFPPPHHMHPHAYGHMGELPMSPMPPMGAHHPAMQSPAGYGSPGMMPAMGYPSPQHQRRPGPPGGMETPGRPGAAPGGQHLPYIPPSQGYDAQTSPATNDQHRYGHQNPSSRVEQRRHPDGSMSISIGVQNASGSSFGGENRLQGSEEQPSMNISDLLLYDNAGGGQNQDANGEEKHAES